MKGILLRFGLIAGAGEAVQAQFNNPPGVEIWCGKAYKEKDASFDPGGWLNPPPRSKTPLLNLQVYPQFNIYTEEETQAHIVITTEINYEVGVPFCESVGTKEGFIDTPNPQWGFSIKSAGGGSISLNETKDIPTSISTLQIPISIADLEASFEPHEIELTTSTPYCQKRFTAAAQIYKLPRRVDGGTVTKLDYLYGGLHVQREAGAPWKPVFPYSFYVDWGQYLKYPGNQTAFAELGYNVVHPTPGGGDTPFEPDLFAAYIDKLDTMDQYLMYDMRWTYKNTSLVTSQIERLKARKSILLWYTADEPDGQSDALDDPLKSYDTIRRLDPYHPVSLVLNCGNFHYGEYTRGAEIIMTDPYPVAINATFSERWNTPCNTTYGDCGCDNCAGSFRDITTRLQDMRNYTRWLSNAPLGKPSSEPGRSAAGPKVFWGVPQVFGGSEYWARPPGAKEEVVMAWLFINAGAKGIMGWNFPTTPELTEVTSQMAKLVTGDEVTGLLLGDNPRVLEISMEKAEGAPESDVDAKAWVVTDKMLISVVHTGLIDTASTIFIKLPRRVKAGSAKQLWPQIDVPMLMPQDPAVGEQPMRVQGQEEGMPWPENPKVSGWHLEGEGMRKMGLAAMEVSILIVEVE